MSERNGTPWTIVLPSAPAPAEAYAAEVLGETISEMTGVRPPVTRGTPGPQSIVLSSGEATTDGFSLVSRPGRLEIRGENPRGALYGVYELLERFGGCGWYTPWRTVVPKRDRFVVPDDLKVSETPAFVMRQPSWYGVRTNELFASRCRLNGESPDGAVPHPDPKYGGCPLRFVRRLYTSHTFLTLVPPEKYFKDHPEYFSLINGQRRDGRTQLCCSNPDVVELVTSNALAFAAADPEAKVVGISPMDWYEFCECPNCRAIVDREGSEAGLTLTLVNAVAERLAKVRPDLKVETLVYSKTLVPPKTVRPHRNVILCSCSQVDYGEPLAKAERPKNVTWRQQYETWTSWTKNLYQWDYTPDFFWFNLPCPNFDVFAQNMRFYRDHGVKYLYMDGAPRPAADFGDLKCWLLAKLAWNPDASTDDLVNRFFAGCYGAAAPHVRRAYDLECGRKARNPKMKVGFWGDDDPYNFPDVYYRQALAAWTEAEAAVKDDPDALFAVRMGKYSPVAASIQRFLSKVPAVWATAHPEDWPRPAELDGLLAEEASIRSGAAARGVELHFSLNRGFDRWMSRRIAGLRKTVRPRPSERAVLTVDTCFYRDGDYTGGEWNERKDYFARLVKDAGAVGGTAVEVYPRDGAETVSWNFDDLAYDRGYRYRVRLQVKADKVASAKGLAVKTAFRNGTPEGVCETAAEALGDGWTWIDVGETVPRHGGKIGVCLPVGTSSPVRSVRVGALEVVRTTRLDVARPDVAVTFNGEVQKDVPFEVDAKKPAFTAMVWVRPDDAVRSVGKEDPYKEGPKGSANVFSCGNGFIDGFRLTLSWRDGAWYPSVNIGKPVAYSFWVNPKHTADESPLAEQSTRGIPVGKWSHLAFTWDGKKAALYVNGVLAKSSDYPYPYYPSSKVLTFGVPPVNGTSFRPYTPEDLKLWKRALGPDEIAAEVGATPALGETEGLVRLLVRAEAGERVAAKDLVKATEGRLLPIETRRRLDRVQALAQARAGNEKEAFAAFERVSSAFTEQDFVAWAEYQSNFALALQDGGLGAAAVRVFRQLVAYSDARRLWSAPYAHFALTRALEWAGQADAAEVERQRTLAMDLRAFPQLAEELGKPVASYGAVPDAPRPALSFFVSPTGDDAADGSEGHPFRTFVRARNAVRAARQKKPLPVGGACVWFRDGVYRIEETLKLDAADGGMREAPVVYRAWGNERPVLTGGWQVPGFGPVKDATALRQLPEVARGHVVCCDVRAAGYPVRERRQARYGNWLRKDLWPPITDLYRDGRPLTLARYPNKEFLLIAGRVKGKTDAFFAPNVPDLDKWAAEKQPMGHGYWGNHWSDFTTDLTEIDPKAQTIRVDVRLPRPINEVTVPLPDHIFYLENALCALDSPGEWYLDRETGILYLWPPDKGGTYELSSFAEPFMMLEGVRNVRFDGLVFENGRSHGFYATNCADVVFSGCVVRNFAGDGLRAYDCRDFTVDSCVFRTMGRGGIHMSGGDRQTLAPARLRVSNCEISNLSRHQHTYTPGVSIDGCGGLVLANEIYDIPSSAVHFSGNEMLIVSNRIHDVTWESDDQGGSDIYYDPSYAGCRFLFNSWTDVGKAWPHQSVGQAAMRFDGNVSGMTVYGNRITRSGTFMFGAVQMHGGRFNTIDNNLFIDCPGAISMAIYSLDHWKKIWKELNLDKCCKERVNILSEPYVRTYPWMETLENSRQYNFFMRNIVVNGTLSKGKASEDTIRFGNIETSDPAGIRKMSATRLWRRLPTEEALGPRPTEAFLRARRNDRR